MSSVLYRKVPKINRCISNASRLVSHQTPFDLYDEDDEHKELNDMYTDMFTKEVDSTARKQKMLDNETQSILDELNSEADQLLNVEYHKLLPGELKEIVQSPGRFIIESLSHNPYYNLAMENYIFNNTPAQQNENGAFINQRLFFYINSKCVVIGKNQNVWKEVYLKNLTSKGYELLRRFSGGGTVVHDEGNVNYSFMTSRDEFERNFFNKLVVKWLMDSQLNVQTNLNSRGDIVFKDKKVSGSAYKIAKGKSYHHGTMLINSQLDQFHGLLKPSKIDGVSWSCNSVESVRSNVDNVPLECTQQFIDICSDGFKNHFGSSKSVKDTIPTYYCDEVTTLNEEIYCYMSTLKSNQWRYLSGPKFHVKMEHGNHSVTVEKGVIIQSTIPGIVGWSFEEFTKKLDSFPYINSNLIL